MKIKYILDNIKGVFILPKKSYYFGKIKYGTPYFMPINFSSSIIKIRKLKLTPKEELDKCPNDYIRKNKKYSNIPMVRRSKEWIIKVLGYHFLIQIGYPFKIHRGELGWKDKFNSPRFEWQPSYQIYFFIWQFCIFWNAPDYKKYQDNDKYYEMILWFLEYSNKDIIKAENTWAWIDSDTKQTTWNNRYVISKNKIRKEKLDKIMSKYVNKRISK